MSEKRRENMNEPKIKRQRLKHTVGSETSGPTIEIKGKKGKEMLWQKEMNNI